MSKNYEQMSTNELRSLVRQGYENGTIVINHPTPGMLFSFMKKGQCISTLETGSFTQPGMGVEPAKEAPEKPADAPKPAKADTNPAPVDARMDEKLEKVMKMLTQVLMSDGVDPAKVAEIVDGRLEGFRDEVRDQIAALDVPQRVEVVQHDGEVIDVGVQHASFEILLSVIMAGCNAYLPGPAGSGKTTAARSVATALDRPFFFQSMHRTITKSELLGYVDAQGKYTGCPLYSAMTEGGIFLVDEMDAGNPSALTVMNMAIDNRVMFFPGVGKVEALAGFQVIGAANTLGTGATRRYVGRNPLDAATLDRFLYVEWAYDKKLEAVICGDKDWAAYVQKVRKAADDLGLEVVISPRASRDGAKLLKQGTLARTAIEDVTIFDKLSPEQADKLRANL